MLSLIVGSCSPVSANATGLSNNDGTDVKVSSPEMARDTTLAYLRIIYTASAIPSSNASWDGGSITSDQAVATRNFLYSFRNWTVSVVSPQVTPARKVFTVIVMNNATDFKWAGLIDASGKILRMGQLQLNTPTPAPATSTPMPTNTPVPPTATMTAIPLACNDATFIDDVTVPDGSAFTPGTQFLKVWQLRNVGTCTWTTDYDLVYVGGNRMGAQRVVPLSETVRPGESVRLGVYMFAPNTPGNYQGFWMLRNAQGKQFGIGDNADDSFWVSIKVVGNVSNYKYDFALNYCAGIWRSATGRVACGDSSVPQNGYVQFLVAPNLENRHENEPTLWVHPNQSQNGWLEGSFPPVTIESGDHFKAWVGCLKGNDACDLTFYLAYMDENNHVYTLQRWHEVYDNKVTVINMDLSNLAGQTVKFILGVQANNTNFSNEQGFWFVPRIEQ